MSVPNVARKNDRNNIDEGVKIMRRWELRQMMEDERKVRQLVHQLMTVGKDVRSTPMHWSYEGTKLDAIVKHLSWRPPWVRPSGDGFRPDEFAEKLLSGSEWCEDRIGLGRSAAFWWTLNCPYNGAFDIHRLNSLAPDVRAA